MQIRLMVDPAEELRSLRSWLAAEPAVRQHARIDEVWEPGPAGAMSAISALSLIVGSGLSLGQLVAIILTWRASRPKPALLRIQVGNRTVEVRADVPDLPQLIRQLEADLAVEPEAS